MHAACTPVAAIVTVDSSSQSSVSCNTCTVTGVLVVSFFTATRIEFLANDVVVSTAPLQVV
jgi:hypothetical protein